MSVVRSPPLEATPPSPSLVDVAADARRCRVPPSTLDGPAADVADGAAGDAVVGAAGDA